MKIKSALGVLAAAALGLAATNVAQAGPQVTDWTYSLEAEWTSYAPTVVSLSGDNLTLSWGSSSTKSSLVIGNTPATGSMETFFGAVDLNAPIPDDNLGIGPTLTHINNSLPAGNPTLDTARLTATLYLTPTNPPAGEFPLPSLAYDIKFEETTNSWTNCPVPESPIPCNDIFVQETGLLNQDFTYDGNEYFVNIFPLDNLVLSILGDDACMAAGAQPGCIGFTTVENETTTLPFGFVISTERLTTDVPEPASLALLGLGLAGLGAFRRRRA